MMKYMHTGHGMTKSCCIDASLKKINAAVKVF